MKAFGPVPSRRLGRSLGINNIPPKVCTYSCVYCQIGRTRKKEINRVSFYRPEEIMREVEEKIERTLKTGESVDCLTIVPDGEPTLDVNIGRMIELLRPLGIKIAVITNASLIWREDVRNELKKADWVSLKVDSVKEEIWHRINRPHKTLQLSRILDGILNFSGNYRGELTTETMLVKDLNDSEGHVEKIADFLFRVKPSKAYLSVPVRPPAEKWVRPPGEEVINRAYQIFSAKICCAECLTGHEDSAFTVTGNIEEDILSITAVHPMPEDALRDCLLKAAADWNIIENLIDKKEIVKVPYQGKNFYVRSIHGLSRI
jgi:wyosine [tRNA(Phe)-imidazoG37] synthetase (radical SAM superfamily)